MLDYCRIKKQIILIVRGVYIFMSTALYFEILIICNKTSGREDFKFMRFNCTKVAYIVLYILMKWSDQGS